MTRKTALAALGISVAASLSSSFVAAQPAPRAHPATTPAAPAAPPPSDAANGAPPSIDITDPFLAPPPPPAKMLAGWRDALTLIASRSTDYAIAAQEVARSEGLARQALGLALPQVDSKGTLQYDFIRSTVPSIDPSTIPPTVTTITTPPTPIATATLTIVQPLFAPRVWHAYGTAKQVVESSKLSLADKRRTLVLAVANAIVAVVTAERVAEINRVGLKGSLERLELTTRTMRVGTGTKLDVVRAQQDVTAAHATIVSGDESLRQARESLGLALGFTEGYGVPPSISLNDLEASARSTCANAKPEDRADVLAAKSDLEVSSRQVTEAKLAFSPTVNAVSLTTYSNQPLINDKNYSWSIQGVLSIPIFDGGSRYGVLRAAKATAEESKARVAGTLRGATLESVQALRGVQVAEQARVESEAGRDLAREVARLAKVSFESGTGTSFDLVDSGRRQREAELDLAVKEFNVVNARLAALLATASCTY